MQILREGWLLSGSHVISGGCMNLFQRAFDGGDLSQGESSPWTEQHSEFRDGCPGILQAFQFGRSSNCQAALKIAEDLGKSLHNRASFCRVLRQSL